MALKPSEVQYWVQTDRTDIQEDTVEVWDRRNHKRELMHITAARAFQHLVVEIPDHPPTVIPGNHLQIPLLNSICMCVQPRRKKPKRMSSSLHSPNLFESSSSSSSTSLNSSNSSLSASVIEESSRQVASDIFASVFGSTNSNAAPATSSSSLYNATPSTSFLSRMSSTLSILSRSSSVSSNSTTLSSSSTSSSFASLGTSSNDTLGAPYLPTELNPGFPASASSSSISSRHSSVSSLSVSSSSVSSNSTALSSSSSSSSLMSFSSTTNDAIDDSFSPIESNSRISASNFPSSISVPLGRLRPTSFIDLTVEREEEQNSPEVLPVVRGDIQLSQKDCDICCETKDRLLQCDCPETHEICVGCLLNPARETKHFLICPGDVTNSHTIDEQKLYRSVVDDKKTFSIVQTKVMNLKVDEELKRLEEEKRMLQNRPLADRMRLQLQEAMNVHCPNCEQVFQDRTEEDMTECFSLKCNGCNYRVCGLCLVHKSDDEIQAHSHVKNCFLNPGRMYHRPGSGPLFHNLDVCQDLWALRRLIQVESVKNAFQVYADHGQAGQVYNQIVQSNNLDIGDCIYALRKRVANWYSQLDYIQLLHAETFFSNNSIDFSSFFSD